jgi:hypothetical protein
MVQQSGWRLYCCEDWADPMTAAASLWWQHGKLQFMEAAIILYSPKIDQKLAGRPKRKRLNVK